MFQHAVSVTVHVLCKYHTQAFQGLQDLELCCGGTVVAGHFCSQSGGQVIYSAPHMRGPKGE